MRRLPLLSSVVLFSLVVAVGSPGAQTPSGPAAGPPPVSFNALIDQALALFPSVQGDVVEVQGNTLVLSIGRAAGTVPGLSVEVYREGREIKHPRTGQVLGRAEEALGTATITRVFDGYSTATLSGTAPAPGDRIRSTAGKVKISLVSLTSPGVKEPLVEAAAGEIYETLNRSG